MASEERLRELEEKYEGYKVYDNRGEKIGKVDDLFINESDREEYIGVKMGFLGMKSTLIPMDIVRVNESNRSIEVSESKDHVKAAPSFDDDEDITHEYEERIRSHFGLQSLDTSTTRSSYGAYSGTGDDEPGTGTRGYSDQEERTEREPATVDTYSSSDEAGERRDPVEDRMRESAAASSGGDESRSTSDYVTGSSGTQSSETQGTPSSRKTEETETIEEGGRTKVRRRIIREEIVEEDPTDRPS